MKSLSVIIPAFNEELNIAKVIETLQAHNSTRTAEILIVDDGSTDRTAQIAIEKGARVIKHPYNKGNGAAIKTGIRNASGELVLFMDADGQHDAKDIETMLAYLGDYDMVIAARIVDHGRPLVRRFANYFLNWLASYLANFEIPDLTSGFRAAKKEIIKEFVHIFPNGFSYPTTSTLSFILSGYNVKFIKSTCHKRGAGTHSKIKPVRSFFQFIFIVFRTIMLFGPFKIFLPISLVLFFVGIIDLLYFFILQMVFAKSSILFILSSIIIFFFGLIADQIAQIRREPR